MPTGKRNSLQLLRNLAQAEGGFYDRRSDFAKLYNSFFGSSTPRQVAWRMGVDSVLGTAAMSLGAVAGSFHAGQIDLGTSLGSLIATVASNAWGSYLLFAVIAAALFVAAGVYKPLPAARVGKRIIRIAGLCVIGALVHLGIVFLFRGLPARAIVIPSWTLFAAGTIGTRVFRVYFTSRYRVTPRARRESTRVEDVLVVGGAGYIGSVLTHQLLDAGYRVRVLDLQLFGIDSLNDVKDHPRLEIIQGDFRNVEDVVRSLRGMDSVVHLAAIVGDPACAVHAETTIAVNFGAAKMMAQLARANGISRFVFASTCSVYGASDETIDEQSSLNPVSLYATTKIDAERALLDSCDDVFRPTILRLATAYGWSYRPRFDLVANLLSAKAVTDGEIRIFNGEQWRPFVNTRDIARSIVRVLESPLELVGGEIFNVGDDQQNYTLSQLGEIVASAVPGTNVEHVRNSEDPRNYRVCFSKIRKLLGFRASVRLEEGIEEIVRAVRGGQVADWRDPVHSNVRQMEGGSFQILSGSEPEAEDHELQVTKEFLRKAA